MSFLYVAPVQNLAVVVVELMIQVHLPVFWFPVNLNFVEIYNVVTN